MNEANDPSRLPLRFRQLVHKGFDGALIEEEVRYVESILGESRDARRWYADAVLMHASLATHGQASETCKRLIEEFPTPVGEPTPAPANPSSRVGLLGAAATRALRLVPRWSIAASALVTALGIGCSVGLFAASVMRVEPLFQPPPWNWSVQRDVVARVNGTHDASWQPSDVPETLPTRGVRSGQMIRLESGLLNLTFRAGGGVILSGPAVFEVRSEVGGKLHSGRASVFAAEGRAPTVLVTPAGRFHCGPGQYGAEVTAGGDGPASTRFHCFYEGSPGGVTARFIGNTGSQHDLTAGDAIQVGSDEAIGNIELATRRDYVSDMPGARWAPFRGDVVHLGNLFDDSKSASLTEAMRTDAYQAAGETIDLGVATVHDGGLDVDVSLADDGVRFDFKNVGGGGPRVLGLPSNDTFRSSSPVPIRTTGKDFARADPSAKCEEGIGMCTNELLTFDLDELRNAGGLHGREMRFVVDRAGINDLVPPGLENKQLASARFVVVVSTKDRVLSGHVDGQRLGVTRRGDVHLFDLTEDERSGLLRRDGSFVSFDVPIPTEARYLTIATTMVDVEHDDHAVFSGARLELGPENTSLASSRASAASPPAPVR